jgi:hypothetical protein
LIGKKINLFSNITGEIEYVLKAYLEKRLDQTQFHIPGFRPDSHKKGTDVRGETMKTIKLTAIGAVVVVCLFLLSGTPAIQSAESENHCFTCHTNPRKLIEITREIQAGHEKARRLQRDQRGRVRRRSDAVGAARKDFCRQ